METHCGVGMKSSCSREFPVSPGLGLGAFTAGAWVHPPLGKKQLGMA